MKSVEQRLFEAFNNASGVRLSSEEVDSLIRHDDAIRTRITNQAFIECGLPEDGADAMYQQFETWHQFKKRLRDEQAA